MTVIPNNPIFNDEDAARAHLERLRWPNGVRECVHCGAFGDAISTVEKQAGREPADPTKRHKPARKGRYYCKQCEGTFTVHLSTPSWKTVTSRCTNGCTPSASSWRSKNGVSAHQLHRQSRRLLQDGLVHGTPPPRSSAPGWPCSAEDGRRTIGRWWKPTKPLSVASPMSPRSAATRTSTPS